jgi:hypothetical protein
MLPILIAWDLAILDQRRASSPLGPWVIGCVGLPFLAGCPPLLPSSLHALFFLPAPSGESGPGGGAKTRSMEDLDTVGAGGHVPWTAEHMLGGSFPCLRN